MSWQKDTDIKDEKIQDNTVKFADSAEGLKKIKFQREYSKQAGKHSPEAGDGIGMGGIGWKSRLWKVWKIFWHVP
jgi:hypothetical protein